MARVILVESCADCPNLSGFSCTELADEDRMATKMNDISGIPDWCPLDTVKELCESNFNIDEE